MFQGVHLTTEEKITVVQASAMLDVSDKVCVVLHTSSTKTTDVIKQLDLS